MAYCIGDDCSDYITTILSLVDTSRFSITEILDRNVNLSKSKEYFEINGVLKDIEERPYVTIFAPDNRAWLNLNQEILAKTIENGNLSKIVYNHIFLGAITYDFINYLAKKGTIINAVGGGSYSIFIENQIPYISWQSSDGNVKKSKIRTLVPGKNGNVIVIEDVLVA